MSINKPCKIICVIISVIIIIIVVVAADLYIYT